MHTSLIAGATGLVGSYCLDFLKSSPDVDEVISLTRKPARRSHGKAKERQIDFANLAALPSMKVDSVFCCLGTTIKKAGSKAAFREVDFEYVLSLAKWAKAQGAKHFLVVSSMGASAKSKVFYSRTKGEMEEALGKLGFPSVDIFRPSLLLGERAETRAGEKWGEVILKGLNPVLIGSLRNYRAIDAFDVAAAMVGCLSHPKPGKHVHLSDEIRKMSETEN